MLTTPLLLRKHIASRFFILTVYTFSVCTLAENIYTATPTPPRILQLYRKPDHGGCGAVRREMQKLFQRNHVAGTTLILDPHHAETYKFFDQQQLRHIQTNNLYSLDQRNFHISIKQEIISLIKQYNFNIALCHNHHDLKILSEIAQTIPIKTCFVAHSFRSIKPLIRLADAIMAVSPLMIPEIKKILDKAEIKADVLIEHFYPIFNYKPYMEHRCNETDRSKFFKDTFNISIANHAIVITSIANFSITSKNHTVLIKAFDEIIKKNSYKTHLILAGSGPRKKEMESLVVAHGLQDNVHFIGFTNNVPDLLYHSDITALTSNQEGCPISLMEASLMKKPIIGTAIPGIKALISDGKTGLLFEKNNHLDLADKIAYLIENPAYAQKLGENAYAQTVANCITPVIEKKILSFFQHLAGTPKMFP
jgi:glycosyltransferase involved in cell wall biosynthesis